MGDLPTAEDLRRLAGYEDGDASRRLRALADALDAGTVRLARADDEPPEGWEPSRRWLNSKGPRWWFQALRGNALVTPTGDGRGYAWSLPHGYPDDAVHRAPSLCVAQYRAEAALRAAGERVPR